MKCYVWNLNTYSDITSTYLISRNQPETICNNQCSNESDVTKRYKVIESNVQNPELNNLTLH